MSNTGRPRICEKFEKTLKVGGCIPLEIGINSSTKNWRSARAGNILAFALNMLQRVQRRNKKVKFSPNPYLIYPFHLKSEKIL